MTASLQTLMDSTGPIDEKISKRMASVTCESRSPTYSAAGGAEDAAGAAKSAAEGGVVIGVCKKFEEKGVEKVKPGADCGNTSKTLVKYFT